MKFRIFRCDPRVRGPGHWEAEYLPPHDRVMYLMAHREGDVHTPLHPGVIDARFVADPHFYWVPREVFINE